VTVDPTCWWTTRYIAGMAAPEHPMRERGRFA
jgi:hypothetical protein